MRRVASRGRVGRALVLGALLLLFVGRNYWQLPKVGTSDGSMKVVETSRAFDGAAGGVGAGRASLPVDASKDMPSDIPHTRTRALPTHPESPDPLEAASIETNSEEELIAFLHEDIPGYPDAFGDGNEGMSNYPHDDSNRSNHHSIPKVMHVSWKDHNLPAWATAYLATWKTHHPSWRVAWWTDRTMRDFVKQNYPNDLKQYDKFPNPVNRADMFRYMVLYTVGGVYVDLDVESLRPIDELIGSNNRCLVGQEPYAHAFLLPTEETEKHRRACNAVMASAPGVEFWSTVLSEIRFRVENSPVTKWNPPSITGPIMLTRVLERAGFDADTGGCGIVDPPQALYPAIDKSQLELAKENCVKQGYGYNGWSSEKVSEECPVLVLKVQQEGTGVIGIQSGDAAHPHIDHITIGSPRDPPGIKLVCCELARDGWVNPGKTSVAENGAFTIHHWVHTWLDGPDARVSNAWRLGSAPTCVMAWGSFAPSGDGARRGVGRGVGQDTSQALTLGVLPSSDEILQNAGPFGTQLGFGAVCGYCAGVALRVAGTAGLATAGVAFLVMQGAQYKGYVDVDWVKVERDVTEVYEEQMNVGDGSTSSHASDFVTKQMDELAKIAKFGIPGAGGFSLGLAYGVGGWMGRGIAMGSLWTIGPTLGATHAYQVSGTFREQIESRSPFIAETLNKALVDVSRTSGLSALADVKDALGGYAGDAAWRLSLLNANSLNELKRLERNVRIENAVSFWKKKDEAVAAKLRALERRRVELKQQKERP